MRTFSGKNTKIQEFTGLWHGIVKDAFHVYDVYGYFLTFYVKCAEKMKSKKTKQNKKNI